MLTMSACSPPEKEIKVGRYGMMSDKTPQYVALAFVISVYTDKTLDSAVQLSSKKFTRLLRAYHTNSGVQRHIFSLRLNEITAELAPGGSQSHTQLKNKATVDVIIAGKFNNDKVVDLKTISLVKQSDVWKIAGVSNTIP